MRTVLNEVIDAVQAALPPNRLVMLVSLLVVAPLVATGNAWAAENLPGVELPVEAIAGAFLLGFGGSVAALYKWIDGQQGQENREHMDVLEARASERFEAEAKFSGEEGPLDYDELDEIDDDELDLPDA